MDVDQQIQNDLDDELDGHERVSTERPSRIFFLTFLDDIFHYHFILLDTFWTLYWFCSTPFLSSSFSFYSDIFALDLT